MAHLVLERNMGGPKTREREVGLSPSFDRGLGLEHNLPTCLHRISMKENTREDGLGECALELNRTKS